MRPNVKDYFPKSDNSGVGRVRERGDRKGNGGRGKEGNRGGREWVRGRDRGGGGESWKRQGRGEDRELGGGGGLVEECAVKK